MKPLFSLFFVLISLVPGWAATTINSANKYAYGANLGWMDWRGDTNSGVVIGEYVCSGYIYAANVGWIHLGSNAPANGICYQNNSATDYGVNHDGQGNLSGYAWGPNIGWVVFTNTAATGPLVSTYVPRVDLKTGRLGGYAYSVNCGWISLSNAFAFVQTDAIAGGADSNANGLPDAWERENFGALGVNPNADPDRDGMSNKQEYLAGTNPNDPNDKLAIRALTTTPGGTMANVTWKSTLTRCYYLQQRLDLNPSTVWFDSGLGQIAPDGTATLRTVTGTNMPMRFYRVQAVRPLSP